MKLSEQDKKAAKEFYNDKNLLRNFGIRIYGHDPGWSGYLIIKHNAYNTDGLDRLDVTSYLNIESNVWRWLKPLLQELQICRLSKQSIQAVYEEIYDHHIKNLEFKDSEPNAYKRASKVLNKVETLLKTLNDPQDFKLKEYYSTGNRKPRRNKSTMPKL